MSTEPTPSQLVAIRKDRKFVRGVIGAGPLARKHTRWHPDRGDLEQTLRCYRQIGWKLLYIETCQLHSPSQFPGAQPGDEVTPAGEL